MTFSPNSNPDDQRQGGRLWLLARTTVFPYGNFREAKYSYPASQRHTEEAVDRLDPLGPQHDPQVRVDAPGVP